MKNSSKLIIGGFSILLFAACNSSSDQPAANGGNITISVKDGKTMINGKATILASIKASNGVVHVIDEVLLPPSPAK